MQDNGCILERSFSPECLGSHCYNKKFDDHFGVKSKLRFNALAGKGKTGKTSESDRVQCFPEYKNRPEAWGIKVSFLWKIYQYVDEDFHGYAAAHVVRENDFETHVCLASPCCWDHLSNPALSLIEASCPCQRLNPSMHLLVNRYVKIWTADTEAGFALTLNAMTVATQKGLDAKDFCFPQIFVSHCWNESYKDFVTTLHRSLDPDCVVWVCSFAIWQNSSMIADALSDVESCPFAKAMHTAERVMVVTDRSAEAFDRCWVVFEAECARKWGKPYEISLPDILNVDMWKGVCDKLDELDVRQCKASRHEDKESILKYAAKNDDNGIDGLNRKVRNVAAEAWRRAKLLAAIAIGDTAQIDENDITSENLTDWRSVRGWSVTHIAAAHSQIAALVDILKRTSKHHIDMEDRDGHTPLIVAIESGALASVEALLCFRADHLKVNKAGLTPLHYAAAYGHTKICRRLMNATCDIEKIGSFEGHSGTPLALAAKKGHSEVIHTLVEGRADLEACSSHMFTPLILAAIHGHSDAAVALVALRANVDGADKGQGRTPLMFACSFGRPGVVSVLLGLRADLSKTSGDKKDVFHYCDKSAEQCSETACFIESFLRQHVSRDKEHVKRVFEKFTEKRGIKGFLTIEETACLLAAAGDDITFENAIGVLKSNQGDWKSEQNVNCEKLVDWIFD